MNIVDDLFLMLFCDNNERQQFKEKSFKETKIYYLYPKVTDI